MSLQSKAVLLRCRISKWDGAVRDVAASKQFTKQNNMDENSGVFNKYLISKNALKPIDKAVNDIRNFHHKMTVPWSLEGVGLITNNLLLEYMQGMRQLKDAFDFAVRNFIDHYDVHVSDAKKRLGPRFIAAEFPSKYELQDKFSVEIAPLPIPSSDHMLIDLTNAGLDKTIVDKEVNKAVNKAMSRVWSTVTSRLTQLHDVLADTEHRVHKSHFDFLRDYIEKLQEFNLFEDENFDAFADFINTNVLAIPIDLVKHSPDVRLQVVAKLQEAITAAQPYTGGLSGQETQDDQRAAS